MKMMKFSFFTLLFTLTACSSLQRSANSGYGNPETTYERSSRDAGRSSAKDKVVQQTAYELGKDPNSLSENDLDEIRTRQRVRELERTLGSKKEKEQYSKVLPWLKDDEEKISFLSIPSLEGRQQWISSHQIWDRSQAPKTEMKELIETQDIAVGMPLDYVKKSWGEPASVEVSGNPIYHNERWKYQRFTSTPEGYRKETRYVYFEGGRVVGWETE